MKNIYKFNKQFDRGYCETRFGYYTQNTDNPAYYEGNCIVIEDENQDVYECLQTKKFAKIVATKDWFEKQNEAYEVEKCFTMQSGHVSASEFYKNCHIEAVTSENFPDYYDFIKYQQMTDYSDFYNPPKEESSHLAIQHYLIYNGEKAIGSFDVYDGQVFEDVYLHNDYRKQGIMGNYLNYLAKGKTIYLMCEEEVLPFYEKIGFSIVESFTVYSKIIFNDDEFVKRIVQKQILGKS